MGKPALCATQGGVATPATRWTCGLTLCWAVHHWAISVCVRLCVRRHCGARLQLDVTVARAWVYVASVQLYVRFDCAALCSSSAQLMYTPNARATPVVHLDAHVECAWTRVHFERIVEFPRRMRIHVHV